MKHLCEVSGVQPSNSSGLIAKTFHQLQQMRWRIGEIPIQIGAKPFANFLTERHAMHAADPTIALGRAIRHEISVWFEIDGSSRLLSVGGHNTSINDFLVRRLRMI